MTARVSWPDVKLGAPDAREVPGPDANFVGVFRACAIAGHAFGRADVNTNANVVVVNSLFVDEVFGGRNAVGRRIRYAVDDAPSAPAPGPWLEIVGVVPNLVLPNAFLKLDDPAKPMVYRPLGADSYPVHLAARSRARRPRSKPSCARSRPS